MGIWADADESTLLERWDRFALGHARSVAGVSERPRTVDLVGED